jgi:hypothetical protein
MMSCVIPNSAAPAGAKPVTAARRGVAHEENRRPTRTTAKNPNVRSFTVIIYCLCERKAIEGLQGDNRAELFGI